MWIGIRLPLVLVIGALIGAYIAGNVTALSWKGCHPAATSYRFENMPR